MVSMEIVRQRFEQLPPNAREKLLEQMGGDCFEDIQEELANVRLFSCLQLEQRYHGKVS